MRARSVVCGRRRALVVVSLQSLFHRTTITAITNLTTIIQYYNPGPRDGGGRLIYMAWRDVATPGPGRPGGPVGPRRPGGPARSRHLGVWRTLLGVLRYTAALWLWPVAVPRRGRYYSTLLFTFSHTYRYTRAQAPCCPCGTPTDRRGPRQFGIAASKPSVCICSLKHCVVERIWVLSNSHPGPLSVLR